MSKTILPSQTGAAGKFLKSDGTDATFETIEQSDVSGLGTSLDSKADLTYVDAQLAEKANKEQEAWITSSFLGGATGTLKYRKNDFGRVEFTGDVTHDAAGQSVFLSMPSGYKLSGQSRIPIAADDGTIGSLAVLSDVNNGQLYLSSSLTGKKVSFNGVTYQGV